MARRRILATVLPNGRWSVRNRILGYRICNHYHEDKDPDTPSHVHYPEDVYLCACTVPDAQTATRIMRSYAHKHDWFHMNSLQKEMASHGHPHDP